MISFSNSSSTNLQNAAQFSQVCTYFVNTWQIQMSVKSLTQWQMESTDTIH